MDTKLLEQANEINKQIGLISNFIEIMDDKEHLWKVYPKEFSEEFKNFLRPILKDYQEKLFNQLKNL